MNLFVLLLIHFIGLKAREIVGQNDTPMDRPLGLSESPPLFNDFYATESHESYQPDEPQHRHHQEQITIANKESFRDAISRMSSENVEYYESDNENTQNSPQSLVSDASSQKFSMNNRDKNDKLVSNLLNGPSSSLSDQQNAQSRLVLLKNNTHSSYSIEDNDSPSADTINNRNNRCDFGASGSRITNYLKLGDKVVKENFSRESEEKNSPHDINVNAGLKLEFDVTHDVFDTTNQGGLHAGIVYRGKTRSMLTYNGRFFHMSWKTFLQIYCPVGKS